MIDNAPSSTYLKDYQAPLYFINQTILNFDLYENHTQVTALLHIQRNHKSTHTEQLPDLVLHGEQLKLISVERQEKTIDPTDYQQTEKTLTIPVLEPNFTLKIITHIEPQNNHTLEGLYKSNGMFCTQCEAEGFRRITYYLDRPDVMSVFTTTITADKKQYPILLSNGNHIKQTDLDNNRHSIQWHDPFKKPSYLFALVAGNLQYIEDNFITKNNRNVTLRIFTEPHNINRCDHAMTSLKKAMRWDEKVYGREYDLDIFMIVAVDHFNMGAMENKGLNIFNSSCILATPETATDSDYQRIESIVAHEYFHNWSGNRVTCRDWFQLSLKEGFTVFRDSQFSADMNSQAIKRIEDASVLRSIQFTEDAGPMAHPIRPESYIEISNFYTVTVYEKGAEVVRMLHTLLGEKQFRRGTDLYFDRHDGQAATCEDFVKSLEDASNKDLTQFRNWYSQAGTPTLTITDEYQADTKTYQLHVTQSCPKTPNQSEKKPFYIPLKIALLGKNSQLLTLNNTNKKETVLIVNEPSQTFSFSNCDSKPLPSLLRNFSAPVKLHYHYSDEELLFLIKNDTDAFNRWDAFQRLSLNTINSLIEDLSQPVNKKLLEAIQNTLADKQMDNDIKVQLLALPFKSTVIAQVQNIHPHKIHEALQLVTKIVAQTHQKAFQELYDSLNKETPYRPEAADIAERSLKNLCLHYLSQIEDKSCFVQIEKQFQTAKNMTDRIAAFFISADVAYKDPKAINQMVQQFYHWYKDDNNVLLGWFNYQSSSKDLGSLNKITELMQHEKFDITNPNKVHALLGGFTQNTHHFHKEDGSGYQFLTKQIIELDKKNPQLAARLVKPFTQWKKYELLYSQLMKKELETIKKQPKLSNDVYELVQKSLNF